MVGGVELSFGPHNTHSGNFSPSTKHFFLPLSLSLFPTPVDSGNGMAIVGIDCEGLKEGHWPLTVQIATENHVVIELRDHGSKGFPYSSDLAALLDHPHILKVFCDRSGADRRALELDLDRTDVVCLEDAADGVLGESKNSRGLINIAAYVLHAGIKKGKRPLSYFIDVDQGFKSPPRSLADIPADSLDYAAADAWFTREAYVLL